MRFSFTANSIERLKSKTTSNMSDVGPPAKRTRLSIRNQGGTGQNGSNSTPRQSRYMLRSNGQPIENVALPEPKRKRRPRIEKLMDLNADCLMVIFQEMDPKTLSKVADTCDRLRNLAKYHFQLKHTDFDFESFGDALRFATDRLDDAELFFRHFGDQIVSLKINSSTFVPFNNISNEILLLIKRYCYQLKELKLDEFDLGSETTDIIGPLFNLLENLTLYDCSFIDCNLGPTENLKRLTLDGADCDLWSDILWQHYPKLESIRFVHARFLNNDAIVQFVNMNPTLKRVSFNDCYLISSSVFKAIGKLEQLEEFEYIYGGFSAELSYENDLNYLSSLRNLKVLKFDSFAPYSPHRLIEKFVINGIAIEHLMLRCNATGDDELFNNIAKVNTLKVLHLFDANLNEQHILNIVKSLKHLETLNIRSQKILTRYGITTVIQEAIRLTRLDIDVENFVLNLPTYLDILAIVQKREQITKLELTVYGTSEQLTVPNEVAKGKNEKWLCVKHESGHKNLFDQLV